MRLRIAPTLTRPRWAWGGLNPLPRLWQHRGLILQLIRRELSLRYKGSYLGVLWSFITPLLMLLIYTFVFSVIFKAKWGQTNVALRPGEYALTLFAGLLPYNMFAEVANRAPNLVLSTPNYVKKVVFPLEILPVVVVGSAWINSLFGVLIWLAGAGVFLHFVPATLWLLLLAYLPLVFLCLGLAWFLAALGVYVRDIGQGIGIVVQMLFFLSPVFYAVELVPQPFRGLILLNPLTTVISSFRRALLWQLPLAWTEWFSWTLLAVLLAWLGYVWFAKTQRGFADVM